MSSSGIGSGRSFRIERWVNIASPRGIFRRSMFMRGSLYRQSSTETVFW